MTEPTPIVIEAPPAPRAPPVELPEVQWKWRRIATFGVLVVCMAIVAAITWKVSDPTALKWIAMGSLGLAALAHGIYLTGATATDLSKIFAAVRGAPTATPPGGST